MPEPFRAYINSYLPPDPISRALRLEKHREQLEWWLARTTMPITVLAGDYRPVEVTLNPRITYLHQPMQPSGKAWVVRQEAFYASEHEWGVMLDDDAILYDAGSSSDIFEEMAGSLWRYRVMGAWYPQWPVKSGFNAQVAKDPRYKDHLIFRRGMDMKGSMWVCRNFRLSGEREVFPDPTFTWGEDVGMALALVAAGYGVFSTFNALLKELPHGASHFSDDPSARKPYMAAANIRLAAQYQHLGLRMKPGSHLLDRTEFFRQCWHMSKEVAFPKAP